MAAHSFSKPYIVPADKTEDFIDLLEKPSPISSLTHMAKLVTAQEMAKKLKKKAK